MLKHYSAQRAKQAIEISCIYFHAHSQRLFDVIFALTAIIPAAMVANESRWGLALNFFPSIGGIEAQEAVAICWASKNVSIRQQMIDIAQRKLPGMTRQRNCVRNHAQNLRVEIGSEPLEGSGFEIEPLKVT